MASVSFDFSELSRLAADLGAIPKEAAGKVRAATVRTAFAVERDAKAFAPVDTGNLRASIGHSDLRMGYDDIEVEIGPTANYGHYVEFGTSRMAPHAYLGPALDRNAPDWVSALEQVMDGLL